MNHQFLKHIYPMLELGQTDKYGDRCYSVVWSSDGPNTFCGKGIEARREAVRQINEPESEHQKVFHEVVSHCRKNVDPDDVSEAESIIDEVEEKEA